MAVEIEEEIRKLLITKSAVTDLVGTGAAARIRPDKLHRADDATEENIIIEVDLETPANDVSGKGGLVYADVNVKCRALTKKEARALAEAVRTFGTNPGTGLAGYGTGSTTFQSILEDEVASREPMEDGSDRNYYVVNQSYLCSFAEVA